MSIGPLFDAGFAAGVKHERAAIYERWCRLRNWVCEIRAAAERQGEPWREPHWSIDDDGDPHAEWFGCGPQGAEPARMLALLGDEEPREPQACVCANMNVTAAVFANFSTDGLATYLEYLRINGLRISGPSAQHQSNAGNAEQEGKKT